MDKNNILKDKYIDWLKIRRQYLENSNRWYYSSLEMLATLGDIHKNIKQNANPEDLFNAARKKLRELINFETLAIFQVNTEDSSFVLTDCDPEGDSSLIQEEVERQIDSGAFAWALKHNRGLVVEDKQSIKKLFFHSLNTKSRVIGMFAGILKDNYSRIPSEQLTLASIILNNTAYAIENGMFYRQVSNQNQNLEQAVQSRTRDLESKTEELKKEISARKRSEEAYKVLARQNQSILEFAEGGIIGMDMNGTIIFVNPCGASMTGYLPDEIIGRTFHSILRPANKEGAPYTLEDSPIQKVIDTQTPCRQLDEMFWKKSGQGIPVEYTCNLIMESGKSKGAVLTFRDITARKRAEEDQRQYEEKLVNSNKELQDFAFIASHDLQEPLRKLLLFGNRLKTDYEHHLDGNAKDYLNNIEKSSIKMQKLVDGLLQFSTITTEARPFQKTDIANVISEVLTELVNPIIKSGARVKVGQLPEIEADPNQMRLMLYNLLHNSLKFQKPDELLVVTISGHEEENGIWSIRIHDNGIGFDEKHLKKIFKPFQQLQTSLETSGQGIGLTICHKIAQRHSGSITAKSSPGNGSVFIIRLPENQSGQTRETKSHLSNQEQKTAPSG